MNKFKVGDKVKIIKTNTLGKITEINNSDYDKYDGYSNRCYLVSFNNDIEWYTVHDLELVEDNKIEELPSLDDVKIYAPVIKENRNKINELVRAINELRGE